MNQIEVSLQDIFWTLKKYLVWIILACIVGAVGAFAYTQIFQTPIYAAKVSMVVYSSQRGEASISTGELTADTYLSSTYAALMQSQPVCEAVSEALNGKVKAEQISAMVSVERVKSTQILNVTISSTNPQLAVEVGNALLDEGAKALEEKAGGKMSPVNRANGAFLVSPNLAGNVTLGFFAGLLISCSIAILIAMLDTTIWREEDLDRAYHIPVLGSIPSMKTVELHNYKNRKGR